VLNYLVGHVVEAAAVSFNPVSLKQVLIDLLEQLCLRVHGRALREQPIKD
jgi:hypothetical protein